jgi:hypothetical protein
MREFLLELYLQHGEREFRVDPMSGTLWSARDRGHIAYIGFGISPIYKLTPKALAIIRNDS